MPCSWYFLVIAMMKYLYDPIEEPNQTLRKLMIRMKRTKENNGVSNLKMRQSGELLNSKCTELIKIRTTPHDFTRPDINYEEAYKKPRNHSQ